MTALDQALHELHSHSGVEHVLLLDREGLLVCHVGAAGFDAEHLAAVVPSITAGCDALGRTARQGEARTVVVELEHGVAIAAPLSRELLLLVLLGAGVGFAPLLRELRTGGERLASLV